MSSSSEPLRAGGAQSAPNHHPIQHYQGAVPSETGGVAKSYTEEERDKIQRLLQTRLPADEMAHRVGPGNTKLNYLESWKSIEMANG
jgi:recombination DNA repair RAD52 pathway protein